jgi:hypothetical protein
VRVHLFTGTGIVLGVMFCTCVPASCDIIVPNPGQYINHWELFKNIKMARCRWLMPVISAIQEAEIMRITVGGQSRQIVQETLS